MCILNLLAAIICLNLLRNVLSSVLLLNVCARCRICLVGNTGRIRTQICDQSDRTTSLDLHTLVQLLRQAHRLLRREIQRIGSLLLQGTRRKRSRCLFRALSFFDFLYDIFFIGKRCLDLLQLSRRFDRQLLTGPIEMCDERLFLTRNLQLGIHRPVLLRDKCIDLILAVADDTQCY